MNELNQLVCVLEVDAHELVDEQGEKGEGLFPFFAMIEHSCHENCAFTALSASSTSTGPSVLRPLPSPHRCLVLTFHQLLFAYLPTSQRRAYLESAYHFHCTCPLCSGELPDKCRAFVCDCGSCGWVWAEVRRRVTGGVADASKTGKGSQSVCGVRLRSGSEARWRL